VSDPTQTVYEVLADALLSPAYASLRELIVRYAPPVAFMPLLAASRAGAGENLRRMRIGTLSEKFTMVIYIRP